MSDNDDYLRTSSGSFRLTADVTALMLKGAGYGALFCFAVLIIAWIWLGISAALPDESKEAFDPTPEAFLIEALPDFG